MNKVLVTSLAGLLLAQAASAAILLRDDLSASEGYVEANIASQNGWTTSGAATMEWKPWAVETVDFIPDGRMRVGTAGVGLATKDLAATASGENLLTFKANGNFRGNFSKARYSLLDSSGGILLQMGCYGSSWGVNTDGSTDILSAVTPADPNDVLGSASTFWDISLSYDDVTGLGSLWANKTSTGTPNMDIVSQVGTFTATFDIDDIAAVQFSGETTYYDQMNGVEVSAVPEPATLGLLGLAFGSLVMLRRRR